MRFLVAIAILSFHTSFSQVVKVDCRDIDALMKPVWKHYIGTPHWMTALDSVMALCPGNSRLVGDRAMAHLIRGEYVEGFRLLDKAVELDPYYYLGNRAWYRIRYLHDYEGAIADFERLEEVAGRSLVYVSNAHMYMLKGLAHKELGNQAQALELYNRAIDEQIEHSGPGWVGMYDYLFRGILKLQMGDADAAIEDFNLQVGQYESLADTWYYRALALAVVGRKDEARNDLLRAKELMLGGGQRRWESFVVLPDEIFLSDIERELLRLY